MTIASALENLNTDIINARTAITTKGGTVTANGGSSQLATDIATIPTGGGSATLITKSITANGTYNASSDNADGYSSVNVNVPTGITPTGTRTITANGTYDVTNYASADVNVSGGASSKYGATIDSILGDVDANGVLQMPTGQQIDLVFNGVESITSYTLYSKFIANPNIKSVSFPSLTSIQDDSALCYAFAKCSNLTSVDLHSFTTINKAFSYTFSECENLTTVNLSGLTSITSQNGLNYTFYKCTRLTSVNLSNLTTISGRAGFLRSFSKCTNLTSIDLSSLNSITNQQTFEFAFQNTKLATLSFPALTSTSFGSYTNQFNNMLSGVTGCTVHFPSNLQSVIGSWSSVTAGFGGTNTTVLFDLTATT